MGGDVTLAVGILHRHIMGPCPSGVAGKEVHCQDQHSCAGNDDFYRRIGSISVLRPDPISHIPTTEIYTGAVNSRSARCREIPGFEMLSEVTAGCRGVPGIVSISRRCDKCDPVPVKNRPGGFCILEFIRNGRVHAIASAYYGLDIGVKRRLAGCEKDMFVVDDPLHHRRVISTRIVRTRARQILRIGNDGNSEIRGGGGH